MNSELYNKTYQIPSEIINNIRKTLISYPNAEGVKRAKFMVNNGSITYQSLKRLKNYFDYYNQQTGDKIQYALAGGDAMKSFIEKTLASDRNAVEQSKKVKQDMTINPNLGINASKASPNLSESKKKKFDIDNYDDLKKNALAVIVNEDNKILLLKRSDYPDQWQPEKWSLVGGSVEEGEEPDVACSREIKEETGLDIDKSKFIERVVIQRNPDSVEHIYACRYDGEPTDIELNKEHSNYGWYDVAEMEYLDTVPNLLDYINLVFIKYD